MKKYVRINFVCLLIFSVIVSFSSCSSDDDKVDNDGGAENIFSFKADGKTYSFDYLVAATSSEGSTGTSSYSVTVVSGKSGENNYGIYNGATLTFTYYTQGEGEYTIVPDITDFLKDRNTKKIMINLIVGTGNTDNTQLYSITGGKVNIKIEDDKYHISTSEPITGIPELLVGKDKGFAESLSLTLNDVYDRTK